MRIVGVTPLIELARRVEDRGGSTDDILSAIRDAGATPVQSMKVLCDIRGIGVGEAKRVVWDSPVWAERRPAQEQFEADILAAIEEDSP